MKQNPFNKERNEPAGSIQKSRIAKRGFAEVTPHAAGTVPEGHGAAVDVSPFASWPELGRL